ncbi:response regulator transcription factor [Ideonella sp. A 288]|uniref:response regulator transcription factor n=1 Tax=Ideonella sp. A 288 TaxID=1962181 RepID=UPI000B4B2756|nr:response regulator [Ideonella sp. A 288]
MSRILVIEDQADIRRLIRWTIDTERHEIHEAANGPQGLESAQRLVPDLVLLDVMMPGGMDGFEVCARIKADPKLAHAPVVMLTARAQEKDHRAGEQAGAEAFLAKPFSPSDLVDTIERLLEQARAPQQSPQ